MKRSAQVTLLLTSAVVLSACQPPASAPKEATPPPSSVSPTTDAGSDASPSPSPTPVASSGGGSGFLMGLLAGRMFSRVGEQAAAAKTNFQAEKKQETTVRNGFGGYGSSAAS